MEKGYDYRTKFSTADGYPCKVANGSFLGGSIMWGGGSQTWGESHKVMAVGPELKSLPRKIRLFYFANRENQFYLLEDSLPSEQIKTLLEVRYQGSRGELTYDSFTVSIAPKGYVAVWLGGGAGNILIATYRAKPVEADFEQVFSNLSVDRKESNEISYQYAYSFVRKEMDAGEFSSQYWEDLDKRYPWKICFNDPRFQVYDYAAFLVNMERYWFESNESWLTTMSGKSIPRKLSIFLKHTMDPIRYYVELDLVEPWDSELLSDDDEERALYKMAERKELLRFFDQFYMEAGDEEVCFYIEFDDAMESAKIKLKSASLEYEIPGAKVDRIRDSERYNIDY